MTVIGTTTTTSTSTSTTTTSTSTSPSTTTTQLPPPTIPHGPPNTGAGGSATIGDTTLAIWYFGSLIVLGVIIFLICLWLARRSVGKD
jgi:beta-lactamase regulating signal transducer with metallopeptidase domain